MQLTVLIVLYSKIDTHTIRSFLRLENVINWTFQQEWNFKRNTLFVCEMWNCLQITKYYLFRQRSKCFICFFEVVSFFLPSVFSWLLEIHQLSTSCCNIKLQHLLKIDMSEHNVHNRYQVLRPICQFVLNYTKNAAFVAYT
jgi:hypothetical protein